MRRITVLGWGISPIWRAKFRFAFFLVTKPAIAKYGDNQLEPILALVVLSESFVFKMALLCSDSPSLIWTGLACYSSLILIGLRWKYAHKGLLYIDSISNRDLGGMNSDGTS